MNKKGLTIIELLVIVSIICVLCLLLLPVLEAASVPATQRASCSNNLRQWGLVFKMYSNESENEKWPPMQVFAPHEPQRFSFALGPRVASIYPEYLTYALISICPWDPNTDVTDLQDMEDYDNDGDIDEFIIDRNPDLIDESYFYLGWVFDKLDRYPLPLSRLPTLQQSIPKLTGVERVPPGDPPISRQLAAAFDVLLDDIDLDSATAPAELARRVNEDIHNPLDPRDRETPMGNRTTDTIFRLREGIERFLLTDINNSEAAKELQADTWVMIERIQPYTSGRPFVHQREEQWGAWVLYFDVSAKFIPYTGAPFQRWPHGFPEDTGATQPVSSSVAHILALLAMDE